MDTFWKTAAAVLISAILCLSIGKREQDFSLLLSLAVSSMVAVTAIHYLLPILDFLRELEALGSLQSGMLDLLLKAIGIGLLTELTSLICSDAGLASLGKTLQLLGNTAILFLSLPIFKSLLTLIREILGQL